MMVSNEVHPYFRRFLIIFLAGAILFCAIVSAQNQVNLDVDGSPVHQTLSNGEVINFLITFDNTSSTVLFVNVTSSTTCGLNINLTSLTQPPQTGTWSTSDGYAFHSWRSGQFNLRLTGIFSTCDLTAIAQSKTIVPVSWNEATVFAYDRHLPFVISLTGNLTVADGSVYTSPFFLSASSIGSTQYQMGLSLNDANGAQVQGLTYTDSNTNLSYVDGDDDSGLLPSILYGMMSPFEYNGPITFNWTIAFIPSPVQSLADNGPPLLARAPYPGISTYTQLILTETFFTLPAGLNDTHNVTASLNTGECQVIGVLTSIPSKSQIYLYSWHLTPQSPFDIRQIDLSSPANQSQWVLNWYQGNSGSSFSDDECSFDVLLDVDHTQSTTTAASLSSLLSSTASTSSSTAASTAALSSSTLATSSSSLSSSLSSLSTSASSSAVTSTSTSATLQSTTASTFATTAATSTSTFATSSSTLLSSTSSTSTAHASSSTTATTGSGGGGGKVDMPIWGVVLALIGAFLLGAVVLGAAYGIILYFKRDGYQMLSPDA